MGARCQVHLVWRSSTAEAGVVLLYRHPHHFQTPQTFQAAAASRRAQLYSPKYPQPVYQMVHFLLYGLRIPVITAKQEGLGASLSILGFLEEVEAL